MHGLGATAGFVLLRVAGEGWETTEDWMRRPGLGAMGGGEGLVVEGSLGLGANGGFFTPGCKEEGGEKIFTHTPNESCNTSTKHASAAPPLIEASTAASCGQIQGQEVRLRVRGEEVRVGEMCKIKFRDLN